MTNASCAAYGALFLAVFALRMRTEFRGESLSDAAHGGSASAPSLRRSSGSRVSTTPVAAPTLRWMTDPVRAVLAKELLYTRRNVGVFYSLIAPLAMVFLFAGRMATRNSVPWVLPATLAYTLVGLMPLSFNSFGLEGAGSQLYFLAPVRLRDVVFAKNLMSFGLAALEGIATLIVVVLLLGRPSLAVLVPSVLWAAATLLVNTSVGNHRSLSAPKQIKLSRLSGKQASPLSALLSLGILLLCAGVGACVLILGRAFALPWLPALIACGLFAAAVAIYRHNLRGLDRYALQHREDLFEELCKS